MNNEINYTNNPLHGLSTKKLLIEIVDHYGFEILFAYLNINCFKTNPSIESSLKFLKKTDWAREKVESFYMYQFKSLPRATAEQFALSPRNRIVPETDVPGEPKELSFEDAERLREKRELKSATRAPRKGPRSGKPADTKRKTNAKGPEKSGVWSTAAKPSTSPSSTSDKKVDPWANAKTKLEDK